VPSHDVTLIQLKLRRVSCSRNCFVSEYTLLFHYFLLLLVFSNKKKLRGLSRRANYTDRATAACRRSQCQLLGIEGCCVVSTADPLQPYSRYSRPEELFFLSSSSSIVSRGWADPVPDPLLLRKRGSVGNRTRTSGSAARNSDHWTTVISSLTNLKKSGKQTLKLNYSVICDCTESKLRLSLNCELKDNKEMKS
jgi:hypothetical protein